MHLTRAHIAAGEQTEQRGRGGTGERKGDVNAQKEQVKESQRGFGDIGTHSAHFFSGCGFCSRLLFCGHASKTEGGDLLKYCILLLLYLNYISLTQLIYNAYSYKLLLVVINILLS